MVKESKISCVASFQIRAFSQITMQEHQTILTNATLSKDSDTISISVIMAVYEIIVYQHNITEKYYKIVRSELW